MRVVLSAESGQVGNAALDWCAAHLGPTDSVIAVVGVSNVGELVLGVPPFDGLVSERELLAVVEHDFCRHLNRAGVRPRHASCEKLKAVPSPKSQPRRRPTSS